MLNVAKEIPPAHQESIELNPFLKQILVEVATENYRQLMFEVMAMAPRDSDKDGHEALKLDPPLRANERIISGLFANAISKVASRSRPEARIDRLDTDVAEESLDGEVDAPTTAGRVDYLAWHGNRVIGIELKAAAFNWEREDVTEQLRNRWHRVVEQTRSAQGCLEKLSSESSARYPAPASIALMVVIARRSVSAKKADALDLEPGLTRTLQNQFGDALNALLPAPTFLAHYAFPQEFRRLVPRRKGKAADSIEKVIYTPFVSFVALSCSGASR